MNFDATAGSQPSAAPALPLYRHLYAQVIFAVIAGISVGFFFPEFGSSLKPLGDAFVALVKMIIAPVIFLTVATGLGGMSNVGKIGSVFGKALAYFLAVSTLALIIGLVVGNVVQPGAGMNIVPATLDPKLVAQYTSKAQDQTIVGFLTHIIPKTPFSALADGEILQVLFTAILFGLAMAMVGQSAAPVMKVLESANIIVFKLVHILMKFAPIGAFGAMAFTIGKYGVASLASLAWLMGSFYLTCLIFIFGVLGGVARFYGFSIFRFIAYIKEELLIVLGTSSSETVLPRMIAKMEKLGCEETVVGLVIPTGYSFNLDGTCIYLTMAALFLAQATNTDLTLWQQLGMLGVLLLTSKGAAGVTGSGFVTLAATLSTVGHIPVASIALILGIDRFMSEARALTNLIGNGVATIVISKSEGALDEAVFARELASAA